MKAVRVETTCVPFRRARRDRLTIHLLSAALALVFAGLCPQSFAADSPANEISVLKSFSGRRAEDSVDAVKAAVRCHVRAPVDVRAEHIETHQLEHPGDDEPPNQALRHSYGGTILDFIVTKSIPALPFALRHRNEIFLGAPIVLFQVIPQLSKLPILESFEIIAAIGRQLPRCCIFSGYCVNYRSIGGSYNDSATQTALAADLVSRLLLSEKTENIPVVHHFGVQSTVDWHQLRRWNLSESALPADTVVLYRQPIVWDRYREFVLGGISMIVLQALLIFYLLRQWTTKRKIEESLAERLTFQHLVSDLSTTFVNLPEDRIDAQIENSLGRIAEFLGMERITLHEFSADRAQLVVTAHRSADEVEPVPGALQTSQFPWWSIRLLSGELALVSDVNELPEDASAEKEYLRKLHAVSVATVPLNVVGEVFGFISFSSTTRHVSWTEDLVQQLKILTEIFSNALERKRTTRALLASMTEIKKSQAALQESDERFRLVANAAPLLIWMSGADKLCTFFSQAWLDFTGRTMDQEAGEGWSSGIHPDDLERCLRIYSGAFDAGVKFEMEYRLRRFDGKYRWVVDIGVPRFESNGAFLGYIGSCVDVTDRKLTEASLEMLSGRLITAHEEERTRIASELHDDFSQRMAIHGIGLEQLRDMLPPSKVEERARAQDLFREIQEMSLDLHSLSHRLHSTRLEHVGLGSALRELCEEISEKYAIQVEFAERGVSFKIPTDVALCLFRVGQEALGNVVKHSHAQRAQVELSGASNEILLHIVDSGVGFDLARGDAAQGIGLISMRERLRLVGGVLSLRSAPTQGTEIIAEVPLSALANELQLKSQAVEG
jgi:PAS domain S-box-containing protein